MCVQAVQGLLKRHGALEQEVGSRQAQQEKLHSQAAQMTKRAHFASHTIEQRMQTLEDQLAQLKSHAQHRAQRLDDSLRSQHYFNEARPLCHSCLTPSG